MTMNTLKDLYLDQLQDLYSACKQSMAVVTENPALRRLTSSMRKVFESESTNRTFFLATRGKDA